MGSVRDYSIETLLIKPLEALFGELTEAKKTHYFEALRKLNDADLQAAFEHLRDNFSYSRFPAIADIQKARKANHKKSVGDQATNSDDFYKAHHEKLSRQRKMANDYADEFMQSPLGAQARGEGWDRSLREYVYAAAHAQAQMIERSGAIGYATCLFSTEQLQSRDLYHVRKKLFDEYSQQAQTGQILVAVPLERMEEWSRYPDIKNQVSLSSTDLYANKRHIKKQSDTVIESAKNALAKENIDNISLNTDTYISNPPPAPSDVEIQDVF